MKSLWSVWAMPMFAAVVIVGSLVIALVAGESWAPLCWAGLGATLLLLTTPLFSRNTDA